MCAVSAWMPFALASNLLFPVGTCKAERVMYLPLIGVCMLAALLLEKALQVTSYKCACSRRGCSRKRPLLLVTSYKLQVTT